MLKISLSPTITSTIPKANLRYFIFSIALAKTKYKDRNPKIAKMLEVYIMKGFLVIENIAGKESTAKIISENSINTKAKRSGVALCFLCSITKNLFPCNFEERGIIF